MKTIDEIVQRGGKLDIYFHDCQTKEEALNKLSPFEDSLGDKGEVHEKETDDCNWVCIDTGEIVITAFYEKEVV